MEKRIKDEGINKQQNEYINLKNKETKNGRKGQPNPKFNSEYIIHHFPLLLGFEPMSIA